MHICLSSNPFYVSFTTYPGFFLLDPRYCSNPDCTSDHVFLYFTECTIKLKPVKKGLAFCIHLDLDTGKEINPPERSPALQNMAEEFVQDLTAEMLHTFKEKRDRDRAYQKRLKEYTIDIRDIEEGNLIAFTDIVAEGGSIAGGGKSCAFVFSHGDYDYYVDDLYCPRPDCKCNRAHLLFCEKRTTACGEIEIRPIFIGMTDFKGEKTVEDLFECCHSKAVALMTELFRHYPSALKQLKESYRTVKKIGARSMSKFKGRKNPQTDSQKDYRAIPCDDHPDDIQEVQQNNRLSGIRGDRQNERTTQSPAVNMGKVGRNEPCPCGSGKKFKKCCGK